MSMKKCGKVLLTQPERPRRPGGGGAGMINSFSRFTPLITAVKDGERCKPGTLFPRARVDKSPSKQSRKKQLKAELPFTEKQL